MRRHKVHGFAALVLAALFAFGHALPARAGTAVSISGLYTTGQETHTENWWQTVDNHWTSTAANSKAYVVDVGGWANSSTAQWISADPTGYPGTTTDYAYSLVFSVGGSGSGSVDNVTLTLALYVDDTATVYVNGTQVADVTGNKLWKTPTALTISSGFVLGNNTLSIQIHNTAGASGLMVSSISGAIVPEVGVWIPLAGALLLLGWLRFRPKKKFPLAA